jgi:hypothetical protein
MHDSFVRVPKVSVIVLNYNGKRHLGDKLQAYLASLLSTDYDEFEVLFVDNGSGDGSDREIRERFEKDHRLRVVRLDHNYGFPAGNNKGFDFASKESKYVALVNNDVKVHKDWLRVAVAVLERLPDVGVVSCEQIRPDGFVFFGGIIDTLGFCYFRMDRGRQIQEVSFAGGAAMVIRRKLFQRLGGLDESFFLQYEEVDFSWRVWLQGYRVVQVSDSVVIHYGSSTLSKGKPMEVFSSKNRLRTIIKNYELKHVFFYGLALSTLYIAYSVSSFMLDGDLADLFYLKALLWNVGRLRETWKKRLVVQASRKLSDSDLKSKGILVKPHLLLKLGRRSGHFLRV